MANLPGPVLPVGTLYSRIQPDLGRGTGPRLRPWRPGDAPVVRRAYADPAIRHWHRQVVDGHEAALAWIAVWQDRWRAETDASWAVAAPDDDLVLGRVSLRDVDLAGGQGECTYWMLPEARGRSLAPRAVELVCRWAFDEIGFHRLTLVHSVANPASCRVAQKTGFALEGTLRQYQLLADGWHDCHLHARLHGDPPVVL
jgi:ribosomal-protein-alanine N-acetyltransferase